MGAVVTTAPRLTWGALTSAGDRGPLKLPKISSPEVSYRISQMYMRGNDAVSSAELMLRSGG